MLNFEIKRSNRQCSKTDRTLQPGEEFYSALIDKDGELERLDYCVESWESPPQDCIGWWKSKVPETGKGKVYWAPRNVMLSYFEHGQQTNRSRMILLTLLLCCCCRKDTFRCKNRLMKVIRKICI